MEPDHLSVDLKKKVLPLLMNLLKTDLETLKDLQGWKKRCSPSQVASANDHIAFSRQQIHQGSTLIAAIKKQLSNQACIAANSSACGNAFSNTSLNY